MSVDIGKDVYHSIYKSRQKRQVSLVILGDSVANQIYPNNYYNNDVYSLACSATVTIAGHYFLLNNFIETNKGRLPKEVILFYNPFMFSNDLDNSLFSFNYFLKPFYTSQYKLLINEYLENKIKKIPYYYSVQFPFIKNTSFSPKYSLNTEEFGLFSLLSKIYIEKIEILCKSNQILFRLESTPISTSRKEELLREKNAIKYMPQIDTETINLYFDKIVMLDDMLFLDNLHFMNDKIPYDYLNLLK
jgi:hypothetical protein